MRELRGLFAFAVPYRAALACAGALLLGESAAALAIPWIAGLVTASVLSEGALALHTVLAAMLAAFAAQALLRFGAAYLLDSASDRIVADLKVRLYDHLQSLPLAYFHERRLGESLALLTSDVYVVGAFLGETAVALVPLALTAAGACILMFSIRADLALLAVVAIPAVCIAMKLAGRRIRPLSARLQDEEAAAIAIAQENLAMLPAIKSFTREQQESQRYRAQVGRVLELAASQRRALAPFAPLVQFVAGASVVLVVAIASSDGLAGRLTAAELVAFLLYAQLLIRPVAGLADVYGRTQAARGALGRLGRALAAQPEPTADAGNPLPRVRGEIAWHGVSFAYPGRGPALEGVDLRVAAGEWIALTGPNGAGKSTLAHLLIRLHEPSSGAITLDGAPIAAASLPSLRSQVGVVPQHVMLLHASVRENIAWGRGRADAAAIEAAARAAGAHEFIRALPQGYDTVIGDAGVRLSGGERQRLALARAILKDPPILILDEATAMFDPRGEEEFLQACAEGLRGRTIVFITHRPASLRVVDRVVHLRHGRIDRIEPGPGRRLRAVAGSDD